MKRLWSSISILILALLLASLTGCIPRFDRNSVRKIHLPAFDHNTSIDLFSHSHAKITPTINVWIHGTRLFSRPVFEEIFNGKASLKPISCMPEESKLKKISFSICKRKPHEFCYDHFYVFGWSGKLSFNTRYETSKALYDQLKDLSQSYEHQFGSAPRIRLITHSHGGNVALNLAYSKGTDTSLCIDELILLACPVQAQTKHLIYDPIFKKIISLYSSLDIIQIIDPQGLYKNHIKPSSWFSERCFPPCDKLHQVKIRMNKRALTHYEFTDEAFLEHLPHIIQEIALWHEQEPVAHQAKNTKRLISLETPAPFAMPTAQKAFSAG